MRWDTNYRKPEPINDPVIIPAYGVTDEERAYWNAKQEALEYDAEPTPYSDKLMISGAIYNALQQYKLTTVQLCQDFYWGVAGGLAQTKEACEAAAANAAQSESDASQHASAALLSMNSAHSYANAAEGSADTATAQALLAEQSKLAAQQSAVAAEDSGYDAEAWAEGTRNGVPVEPDDPAYHHNSKYYADLGQDVINDEETTAYTTYSSNKLTTLLAAKADLVNGKVPAAQLPSYVDDVKVYATLSDFPATGEEDKIYVAADTNLQYRWSGDSLVGYVVISESLALGETSSTAYAGNKGKQNADAISAIQALIPSTATSSNKLATEDDIPTVPTDLADLNDAPTHRLVTDTEKTTWNSKATAADIAAAFNGVSFTVVNDVVYINW